jgi:hypothetical protein
MEYLLAWRMSKTIDAPYPPGNRGLWRKAKWLNRQEFVVGWSDLKDRGRISGRCCSATTPMTASSSMPAVWAQECLRVARSRTLTALEFSLDPP